ncbi:MULTISPECIES: hypothetical protein [unclassified Roseburia]|nr:MULTISPECIES: hypothetical protein [unclassified Roseburia]
MCLAIIFHLLKEAVESTSKGICHVVVVEELFILRQEKDNPMWDDRS